MRKIHVRGAATAAVAAMAFGVAAPVASAAEVETTTVKAASSETESALRPTAADVRDLISRMRVAGAEAQEISEFEAFATQLENGTNEQPRILGMGTIVRKLIVAGLRHGGVWAGKIVGKVSKKAGNYIKKNGNKIADAIEDVEGWSETALTLALVKAGVPTDVAGDIAKGIMLVAG
ncbi:hypothetical protein AB0F42_34455 [Streptomyces buecherae]|uniref:hypothetical protein n=1 Tax=Streptomyces buecherae TaxID=2763006 RepID=UPI0033FAE0B2